MNVAVNVAIHVVTVATVLVTCAVTVRYVRRSREALALLIDIFRTAVDTASIVASEDRGDLRRLIRDVETGVAGVQRLEAAGVVIADDLALSHRNADAVAMTEPPGAAADAASRQTPAEQERP